MPCLHQQTIWGASDVARLGVVVWDVDDTLYLERTYVRSGFQAVSAHLEATRGVEGFSSLAWSAFERGVRGTIFNIALEGMKVDVNPDLIGELVKVYRHHLPEISLLPDARAAMDACAREGLGMAVITDGPLPSQRAKVLALELETFAEPVICTSALGVGFGKPHPKAFEMIAKHHQAKGSELVYVADNPLKDFIAPRSLGWRTIRLRREGGLHCALPSGNDVDVELENMEDIMSLLLEDR